MKKHNLLIATIALVAALTGCNNIGNQPAGMSDQDARSAIEKMTPEQKIKFYANSPMPEEEKKAKFAEIEKETGVSAASVLSNEPRGTGTNSAPK